MKTSFTYLGKYVIETIVDGDEIHYNMMTNVEQEAPPPVMLAPVEEPNVALPLQTKQDLPEKPKRGLRAFIRAAWTFVFSAMGEGLTYLVNNTTSLNLPPGVGVALGAGAAGLSYGIKKYVSPDSLL